MSKKKSAPAKPTRPSLVPEILKELEQVRHEPDAGERSLRGWRLVTKSYGEAEGYAVVDFALEHGLVQPCEAGGSHRRGQGQHLIATWTNPVDESEMVWIPGGPFVIGGSKEPTESKGFSLARHPVTNAQFKRFLDATGYQPHEDHPHPHLFLAHWTNGKLPKGLQDHPVVHVSYLDALAYCRWTGLTLPTEWLWEKAARGPDGRSFPWGEELLNDRERKLAHVNAETTTPIGKYSRVRSPYGCEDMIGNVSEWCQMIDGEEYGRAPDVMPEVGPAPDGKAPLTAVRGACFLRNGIASMKAYHRRRLQVIRRNQWTGFRPACMFACAPVPVPS